MSASQLRGELQPTAAEDIFDEVPYIKLLATLTEREQTVEKRSGYTRACVQGVPEEATSFCRYHDLTATCLKFPWNQSAEQDRHLQ